MRLTFSALLLLFLVGCAVSPQAEVADEPAGVSDLRSDSAGDTGNVMAFYRSKSVV